MIKTAAIITAVFYPNIAAELKAACVAELEGAGMSHKEYRVPGALEIAPAIARLQKHRQPPFACYVALGCVVRGETYHFEVVSNTSAAGIMQLQINDGLVIGNGILTVDTIEQAKARTDKGAAAAAAALALLNTKA